jgi:KRAB domain-containing zinc finger protein
MSNPHPDPVHSCQTCTLKFAKAWELDLHISVEHNNPSSGKFKCPRCRFQSKSSSRLFKHVATVHENEGKFECQYCEQVFSEHSSFRRHLKVHEDKKLFLCSHCSAKFCNPSKLQRHIQSAHVKEDSTCDKVPMLLNFFLVHSFAFGAIVFCLKKYPF